MPKFLVTHTVTQVITARDLAHARELAEYDADEIDLELPAGATIDIAVEEKTDVPPAA